MSDLEAKIVVLGSQGVGKTSLVHRYVKNSFTPPDTVSTIGASFLTKKLVDVDTGTVVRLQIWDTAGQERFRSISKLYYRGANAGVLCYDITDPDSFAEMGRWLLELKENQNDDLILHIVGTKSDVVAQDPSKRAVPFERCIAYVAENLYPEMAAAASAAAAAAPPSSNGTGRSSNYNAAAAAGAGKVDGTGGSVGSGDGMASPQSTRSSGFWGQDALWDCCHEVSSKDGEGVEEVFRVITRKLVEQRNKKIEEDLRLSGLAGMTPGLGNGAKGYFDYAHAVGDGNGSFRVGYGDKRSWLGIPTPGGTTTAGQQSAEWEQDIERIRTKKGGKCC